jgi:pimeloyl-ACP methyl ester carboxylesterase
MMGLLGSEYTIMDKANSLRGMLDAFAVLYPQAQAIDFRRDATRLSVPVYLINGRHELAARRDLVPEWFNALQAPTKRIYDFDNSAHSPQVQEPTHSNDIMTRVVLPETYPTN